MTKVANLMKERLKTLNNEKLKYVLTVLECFEDSAIIYDRDFGLILTLDYGDDIYVYIDNHETLLDLTKQTIFAICHMFRKRLTSNTQNLNNIKRLFKKPFTKNQIMTIVEKLGNRDNLDLIIEFIESDYNIKVLENE